jgi:membrane-bound lytic murein transglycosylase D
MRRILSLSILIAGFGGTLLTSVSSHATFAPQATNYILPTENPKVFEREKILNDTDNRIAPEFKITPEFKDRVSFWFDIYTKYGAQEKVVHHSMYPWIVYRVIDLRPILSEEGNKWVKYNRSIKYAKTQIQDVRNILYRLSRMKRFDKLDTEEQEIFDQVKKVPGFEQAKSRKFVLEALRNLRTQVGQKDFIETGLQSSTLYMSEMERVFSDKELPLELTRLPFVESSFNVDAVSKVGASGIWQVMPYIGRKFLIMDGAVDERNSPVKAAVVAAYILKQNKQILKNWPLALTAYNHGAGSLANAAKKYHTYDLAVLLKKFKAGSFGFASQNFYSSFLAVMHAEKYKEQIFSNFDKIEPTLKFVKVKLTKSTKVYKILEMTGLDPEEFKRYNLDIRKNTFRRNLVLPKGYVLHIPEKAASELLTKNQTIAQVLERKNSESL